MVRQIASHAPTHQKPVNAGGDYAVSSAAAYAPLATSGGAAYFGVRDVAVPKHKLGPSAAATKSVPSTEAASRALAAATSGSPDVSSLVADAARERLGRASARGDSVESHAGRATPPSGDSLSLAPRSRPLQTHPSPAPAPAPALAQDASVRVAFNYFDVNGSGFLDYRELHGALFMMGIDSTLEGAREILRQYDDNRDGKMDLREFGNLVDALRDDPASGAPAQPAYSTPVAMAAAPPVEQPLMGVPAVQKAVPPPLPAPPPVLTPPVTPTRLVAPSGLRNGYSATHGYSHSGDGHGGDGHGGDGYGARREARPEAWEREQPMAEDSERLHRLRAEFENESRELILPQASPLRCNGPRRQLA